MDSPEGMGDECTHLLNQNPGRKRNAQRTAREQPTPEQLPAALVNSDPKTPASHPTPPIPPISTLLSREAERPLLSLSSRPRPRTSLSADSGKGRAQPLSRGSPGPASPSPRASSGSDPARPLRTHLQTKARPPPPPRLSPWPPPRRWDEDSGDHASRPSAAARPHQQPRGPSVSS